ncbi:carbohydrate kinase family protein [Patescibacteria group bacterium]|nr:carbohydrate kinase family protein [Patescibacteria group bacterium]
MEQLDFLAIGDITTDIFIKLKEAEVRCDAANENCTITMRWGDKIPFDSATTLHAVGNSPNAAVSAARLGLTSGLLAWVGNDLNGRECLTSLAKDAVDTSFISPIEGAESNQHYVLWYENERTILVKQNPFPYSIPTNLIPPRYIYLSSLGESATFHNELAAWLATHPETKFVFQPGTFQMKMGTDALKEIYAHCEILFCNKEEAERILKLPADQDIKLLLAGLRTLGPTTVIITDGTHGAYSYDGTQMLFVPMYPDTREPFERTGAGDAFASSVTAALALGRPIHEALLWGPINSMSVVQEIGAQKGLLTREALEKFLHDAPESYKVHSLS